MLQALQPPARSVVGTPLLFVMPSALDVADEDLRPVVLAVAVGVVHREVILIAHRHLPLDQRTGGFGVQLGHPRQPGIEVGQLRVGPVPPVRAAVVVDKLPPGRVVIGDVVEDQVKGADAGPATRAELRNAATRSASRAGLTAVLVLVAVSTPLAQEDAWVASNTLGAYLARRCRSALAKPWTVSPIPATSA